MYIYLTFYMDLFDKVRRKSIHVVDNPSTMFKTMQQGIHGTEWAFYAYQLSVAPEDLYSLYRGVYNSDIPPVISDGCMTYYYCKTRFHCRVKDCFDSTEFGVSPATIEWMKEFIKKLDANTPQFV